MHGRAEGSTVAGSARIRAKNIFLYMKVSVLLPGNSATTVCMTSDNARQQQVGRQTGIRGNLQLLCNWSKAARTGNHKRIPLPDNGTLSCLFIEGTLNVIHETEEAGNSQLLKHFKETMHDD